MSKEISETIIRIAKEKKPGSVEQLISLVKFEHKSSESEILECILRLRDEGKISIQSSEKPSSKGLYVFLKSQEAVWYWMTIVLSGLTLIAVLEIPEHGFPLVYIRYVLGMLFVLYIPGHSLVRALYPRGSDRESEENLTAAQRLTLSIGCSLAFVPIIGILLDYTAYAFQLGPIVMSLLTLTMIFSTVALIREFQARDGKAIKHGITYD